MADSFPTFEQASAGQLPSFEDATKPRPSSLQEAGQGALRGVLQSVPVAGPIADAYFNGGPLNHIAKAFGQSFEQNYGSGKPSDETEDWLRKNGVWNDWSAGQTNIFKGLAESFGRPAIAAGSSVLATLGAVGSATEQAGSELKGLASAIRHRVDGPLGTVLATPIGMAGEYFGSLPSGFLPELHIPYFHAAPVAELRANSVIGEGEAGYFGTKPPSPEQVAARNEATAYLPQPAPESPDLHTVARQLAPDTFSEYDALAVQRDQLRQQIETLRDQQPDHPRRVELQSTVDDILAKVGGNEERLTNAAAGRLDKARSELETTPEKVEAPEQTDLRQKLLETDFRMRDLAPDVATAYRLADEQVNPPGALEKPTDGVSEVQATQDAPNSNARPTGSESPIEADVRDKLTKAGRPTEEADAAAALVRQYYETRSGRFQGKLGSAEDLYNKEGPEVEAGTGRVKGKLVLGQARNTIKLFQKADASTFFHETGHDWLERLAQDARHPEAPSDVINDHEIVKNWYNGTKSGLKTPWSNTIPRQAHEMWARGFERYLMEGRAPTQALASVFAKFKQWLQKIYKTVSSLKSPINDDLRDVFSRLLSEDPDYRGVTAVPEEEPVEGLDKPQPTVFDKPEPGTPELTVPKDAPKGPNDGMSYNQSDYVDKAGKINFNAITSDETMQNFLRAWAEQNNNFVKSRGLGLTKSDIIEQADLFGTSAREMQRNLDKLRKLTVDSKVPLAVRVKALAAYVEQNTQRLMDAAQDNDPYALATAALDQLNAERTFAGVQTSWGQVGQALQSVKAASVQGEMISELLQNSIGRSAEDVQKDIARIKRLDSPAKIAAYSRSMVKASVGEGLLEGFKNYLISGPITHMMYTLGNKVGMFMKAGPETFIAGVVGDIRESLTGKPSEVGQRVFKGEAAQGLYAFFFGQRDGLKAMWDSFKAGQTLPLPGEDLASTPFTNTKKIPDFKNVLGTGVDIPLGSFVRLPGERMVAPIHSADRTVGYLTKRAQLIYRQAVNENLEPGSISFAARMAELYNDKPSVLTKEDMLISAKINAEAVTDATEGALMGPAGELTRRIQAFTSWETQLPLLGRTQPLGFISPFVHVSGNIMRMSFLERSPIGFFSRDSKGLNGTLAQDTAIAKATVGTAVWGTLGGLFIEGLVNPGPPTDYKEANVNRMVNGLPYSVRVGDMTYAYDRLGVWGSQMAIGVDLMHSIQQGIHDDSIVSAGSSLMHSLYHHVSTEGFMSGFSDLMKAVDEPDKYGANWVKNFLSTAIVPFSIGSAQIAQRIDPYSRQAKTLTDAVIARIPFASETLPAKIDIFGQPVPNKEFWGVYSQQVSADPVLQKLSAESYFPAPVKKTINGIELTPKQYEEYATLSGIILRQQLEHSMLQPFWEKMPPENRHSTIESAVTASRTAAQGILIAKYRGTGATDIGTKAHDNQKGLTDGFHK